jgi:hypothetical protein
MVLAAGPLHAVLLLFRLRYPLLPFAVLRCAVPCRNAKKSSDLGELSAYLTQVRSQLRAFKLHSRCKVSLGFRCPQSAAWRGWTEGVPAHMRSGAPWRMCSVAS